MILCFSDLQVSLFSENHKRFSTCVLKNIIKLKRRRNSYAKCQVFGDTFNQDTRLLF